MGYTRYRFVGDGTSHVGSYAVTTSDDTIMVAHSAATYIVNLNGNFAGNIPDGMTITIKDASGNASFYPITINAASGLGFQGGVTSNTIKEDFGSRTYVWTAAFAVWQQVAGYVPPTAASFMLTANVNDFVPIADIPGAPVGYIAFTTNGSSWDVTGINSPLLYAQRIVISNANSVGVTTVTLKHENAGSVSTNRFFGVAGADRVLNKNESTEILWVPGPIGRWRVLY